MLFLLVASTFAASLHYQVNHVYEYSYNSLTEINAENAEGARKYQGFQTIAKLRFHCVGYKNDEYAFEMTASNVHIFNHLDGKKTKVDSPSDKLDSIFKRALVFGLDSTGQIIGVSVDRRDEEDVVNMKLAMAEILTTKVGSNSNSGSQLVCDTQGQHYVHSELSSSPMGEVVDTYCHTSDFLFFRDENADQSGVEMDMATQTVLQDGIATSVTSTVMYDFSSATDNDVMKEGYESFSSEGRTVTTLLDVEVIDQHSPVSSDLSWIDASRRISPKRSIVKLFSPSYYSSRTLFAGEDTRSFKSDEGSIIKPVECPSSLTLCKGYEASYTIGNTNFGVATRAQVMVGTNKECTSDTRNYYAGSEANVDLYVFGKKYVVLTAHLEYGYIDGAATRNGIEVAMFDKVLYSKKFPEAKCSTKTINLAHVQKSFPVKYTVHVLTLPVSFTVHVDIDFSAKLPYQYCLADVTAEVGLIPTTTITASAGAESSILLIRGGIKFTASVTETLDPTAYLDGAKCRVGIKAVSHTSPFKCEFAGWYQTRQLTSPLNWSDVNDHPFWKWEYKAIDYQLFHYTYALSQTK